MSNITIRKGANNLSFHIVMIKNDWNRFSHFSLFLSKVCLTWLYRVRSPTEACRKWDTFLILPPWPGNYPNLPSSCAPAPAPPWLRPPLWLHYQCWDSLMAWRPRRAGCYGGRKSKGEKEKRSRCRRRGKGKKRWDAKEQEAALKVNISIMMDNAP